MSNPLTEERFWSNVKFGDSCWEFQIGIDTYGYGMIRDSGKLVLAHRFSWMLSQGDIPKGVCVLHKCDNRRCVRVDHLFLRTQDDNMKDMVAKNRQADQIGEKNGNSKLTRSEVEQIRKDRREGVKLKPLSIKYGVTMAAISKACCLKSWNSRN